MQLAIGTKKVLFEAMSSIEFNRYMGVPESVLENDIVDTEGYLVEYLDGGPSNHKDHEHYISWSPKDVWDAAYEAVADGMSFSHALVFLESGDNIARKVWKSEGLGEYVIKGYHDILTGLDQGDLQAKDWVVVE